jgi:ribosomal protein S18 acetylase RimI-like enzyme
MRIDVVELRPLLTLADAEMMRIIRNECREYMTNNTGHINLFSQIRWWRKIRNDPNWMPYLLWEENVPVGYGIIRFKTGMHWITGGIITERRGQGLGRTLFAELTGMVTKSSAAYLEVLASNQKARNLYESLGYRSIGEWRKGVITMSAYPR